MTHATPTASTVALASSLGLPLVGTDGADSLDGGDGADWLVGNTGNDTLHGGVGADTLDGGAGDDQLHGGAGDDSLRAGRVYDTASFAWAKADMLVDLTKGLATGEGRDRLIDIERVIASAHDDTLIGDAANNRLVGLDGDDVLIGGAGNDSLAGNNGDDDLTGGAGNDTLWGDGGDDTARFAGRLTDYTITAVAGGWVVRHVGGGGTDGTDTLRAIETAAFADRALHLDGSNNAPIATDDVCAINNKAAATLIDALANDYDFEGGALTLVGLDTSATRGQATLTADGHVHYVAGSAFAGLGAGDVATDTLRYIVADDEGALTTATLTLRVVGQSQMTLVSADASGRPANGHSSSPSVSADGRFVAFSSNASNLAAGDDAWSSDVFVKDLNTGAIERVSTAADHGIFRAGQPDLSADGRYVAFDNGIAVIVDDRSTGARTSIEIGQNLDGMGLSPSISDDGRFVVFASSNPNLVAGDTNHGRDIFLADRTTGAISRVNTDGDGGEAIAEGHTYRMSHIRYSEYDYVWVGPNEWDWEVREEHFAFDEDILLGDFWGSSDQPVISGDGRFVAFASDAFDDPDVTRDTYTMSKSYPVGYGWTVWYETALTRDIFVKDLLTGALTKVSQSELGEDYDATCHDPALSADGHVVAFASNSTLLVPGDHNWCDDVFVRDLATGTLVRASAGAGGQEANGASYRPTLSADGRFVSFVSNASNLIADDDNGVADVFVRDLVNGTLTRVSRDAQGGSANGASYDAVIAGDGHSIVFASYASDIGVDHDASVGIFQIRHDFIDTMLLG